MFTLFATLFMVLSRLENGPQPIRERVLLNLFSNNKHMDGLSGVLLTNVHDYSTEGIAASTTLF